MARFRSLLCTLKAFIFESLELERDRNGVKGSMWRESWWRNLKMEEEEEDTLYV